MTIPNPDFRIVASLVGRGRPRLILRVWLPEDRFGSEDHSLCEGGPIMRRTHRMAACAAIVLCMSTTSSGQGIAEDGFGGGPMGNLDGRTGGAGWSSAWQSIGSAPTNVIGTGLTYPGLATTEGAAATPPAARRSPTSIYQRSFPALVSGHVLYVSFLLRPDADAGPWSGISFGSAPDKASIGLPSGAAGYGIALSDGTSDITGMAPAEGETVLFVVRINDFAMPDLLSFKVYVNPVVGDAEPGWPDASLWQMGPMPLPTALAIDNGTGWTTDELRVGTTWASVLPSPPSCVADFDGSGTVDGADLAILLGAWGVAEGDLTGDGLTDGADLAVLLGAWGPCL